uniref:Uncharacterized protein n=1 Tax=Arundo donax TaxID=35708 RepID=A0A0A9A5T5_ARUDO
MHSLCISFSFEVIYISSFYNKY